MSDSPVPAERDGALMRRALELALNGWGRTAPNPMVGAVVVRDGAIVGEGWHGEFGGPHAEVEALRRAGDAARGATLYVGLEPCSHHGKTPPCTDAVIAAGIRRVVVAAADPGASSGGGARRLREAGIQVDFGPCEAQAREINAPFFRAAAGGPPWLTLKLAVSLDGAITDARRSSAWLTGAPAREEVHRMRAGSDAILVGIGTVLADDPLLTVRGVTQPRVPPVRIVLDRGFRTPTASKLVSSAREVPVLVVSTDRGRADDAVDRRLLLEKQGVDTIVAAGLPAALEKIARRGFTSVLAEGGAGVAGALLDDRVTDRLVIFQAPVLLGAGSVGAFSRVPGRSLADALRLTVLERREFGADTRTVYAINSP